MFLVREDLLTIYRYIPPHFKKNADYFLVASGKPVIMIMDMPFEPGELTVKKDICASIIAFLYVSWERAPFHCSSGFYSLGFASPRTAGLEQTMCQFRYGLCPLAAVWCLLLVLQH